MSRQLPFCTNPDIFGIIPTASPLTATFKKSALDTLPLNCVKISLLNSYYFCIKIFLVTSIFRLQHGSSDLAMIAEEQLEFGCGSIPQWSNESTISFACT